VPFGPVMTIDEIAQSPHFAARGMLAEIELPDFPEPVQIAGSPIKLARTPAEIRGRAPDLGADTRTVLRRHGVSEADIAAFAEAGAIRKDPP